MPLVRITYPRGALASTQKRRLAARLTEIVLDAEVDAVTESGREVREGSWGAAGRSVSALDVAPFSNPELPGARRQETAKVAPERLSA
jgi:phenylpyruvate tautomerase PptA (4-oxalocrotonate tautomerase family)